MTRPKNVLPISSPRLSGPNYLSDVPMTVEDWRIVHHAYMAFMTTVRRVAEDAWKREAAADAEGARGERGGGTG